MCSIFIKDKCAYKLKMIKDKEIQKQELKLKKLADKIASYQSKNYAHTIIVKLEVKYQELERELNEKIAQRLIQEDKSFATLAEENVRLIQIPKIVFKTSKRDMSITGSHAIGMKGRIHNNGHIYCDTKRINFSLFSGLSSYQFPTAFKGNIDCLGNITLSKSGTGFQYRGIIPLSFEGSVNDQGKISITMKDKEIEYHSKGTNFVSRIVSSYIFKDQKTEQKFYTNKEILLYEIRQYRDKLREVAPSSS